MVVTMEVKNLQAFSNVQRIVELFPVAVEDAGNDFGESVVRAMKRELTAQNLIWRRRLHRGIKWHRRSKVGGYLSMPIHGVYLDSMKPHFVKLKRGRLIREWAKEKGVPQPFLDNEWSIKVKPHPWIRAPVERRIAALPQIIKRHTNRVIQSKGRRK